MDKISIFVCSNNPNKNYVLKNRIFKYILAGASLTSDMDNNRFLKDSTGDNISSKNKLYNELTVQYWMWKNFDSDYYGLCHYRRFISFSDKRYKIETGEHDLGLVSVPLLSNKVINEHNLENENKMSEEIAKYDLICMEPISVRKYFPEKNMYNTYKNMPLWHNITDIDNALQIIKELYPNMYDAAHYYFFKSKKCYYYNCWVMKKELFQQYSKFMFDVLFKLENKIDYTHYSNQLSRALGLVGERLFGVFLTYIERQKKYKINHKQVIFVKKPYIEKKLSPFFKENNVPIVTICNNFYVPYFAALLASLVKHSSPSKNYDFIVFANDIDSENKKLLKKIIMPYSNISLRFYDPTYEINDTKFYMNSNSVTENTYYRLFTPWILSNYDKAIVLDADLVFNEDPSKLYDIDVNNYYIGAVKDAVFMSWVNGMDISFKKYAYEYMKLKNPYNYVNTGVMLMNLSKIRLSFALDDFIKLNTIKPYKVREQDSMNVVFEGKIKFIPLNWNFYIAVNDFLKKCMPNAPRDIYSEYLQAQSRPYILHWASYPKPWIDPTIIDSDIWWNYSKSTPFYEICLNRLFKQKTIGHVSFLRKTIEKLAPPFSRRRALLKRIMWKSSSSRSKIIVRIYRKVVK